MNTRRTFSAFAVLFTVLSACDFASAQGLADFARTERVRRSATTQKEASFITNETLARKGLLSTAESRESRPESNPQATAATPVPATAVKQPSTPAKPSTAAKSSTETEPKKEERGEQWWRTQFATAKENISRAEAEALAAETQLKKANTEFLIRSDIYNKEGQLGPRLQTLSTDAESAKKRADEARKKIGELEEALRKAGGLPGWAR